jgi:hypothetical protein
VIDAPALRGVKLKGLFAFGLGLIPTKQLPKLGSTLFSCATCAIWALVSSTTRTDALFDVVLPFALGLTKMF